MPLDPAFLRGLRRIRSSHNPSRGGSNPPRPTSPHRRFWRSLHSQRVPVGYPIALAVALLVAPAASATPRPMTDPIAMHEVRMGVAWWTAHGVYGCPDGVTASVAPDRELRAELDTREDVEALATVLAPHVGGCEFVVARSIADIYRTYRSFEELDRTCRRRREQFYCSDRVTVRTMRDAQTDRCSIVRHELGHAIGGLDDDELSPDLEIVQAMAQNDGWNVVYDDCEALADATWRYRRPHR